MRPLLAAACVLAPALAFAADDELSWTGNVFGYLGGKWLSSSDWDPVQDQGALGIVFETRPRSWPVSLAANLILSAKHDKDDATDIQTDGSTAELQVGVNAILPLPGHTHLFIGGGPAIVSASYQTDPPGPGNRVHDEDSALGAWAAAGAWWDIHHFVFGPRVGWSYGKVTLFHQDVEAGGWHAGVMAGYHW